MKHKAALFPGSFDPLTNGHMDIIRRSLEVFQQLKIAILSNPQKNHLFSVEERIQLIAAETAQFKDRVSVTSFSGLLVDFAQKENTKVIIRGLRAVSDFDYEAQMALVNKNLCEDIETFFLMAREENSYISSSIVKQVALLKGDISKFVPPKIAKALLKKLKAPLVSQTR